MAEEKRNLPTLQELIDGDIVLKAEQSKLNLLLNQDPPASWIKEHPFAKGVKYIPIGRIEYLLTRLFIKWHPEVKGIQVVANSVAVTIRLHYQNIENNEWSWVDGVGAAPIQTEKGEKAMEQTAIRNDAVMKALPAAKSFAIKDAADHIGKIFGRDLNRKDEIIYDSLVIPNVEEIKMKEFGYAEELVRKSTFEDHVKEQFYAELARTDLTRAEFDAIINKLKESQQKKY
jgi:hypothetical protein